MKKSRIAYYTDVDLNGNDGPAVNEFEFLKSLITHTNNNFLFVTNKINKEICKKLNINYILYIPNVRMRSFFINLYYYLVLSIKIYRFKPDVLVCRLFGIPIVPFIYKFLFFKKIAIKTAAVWYIEQEAPKNILQKYYQIICNFIVKKLYQHADVIDTALHNAREILIKDGIVDSKKIKIIDNGINTSKFCIKAPIINIESLSNCFPIFGFMGSLPTHRGAKQALEVAKRIQKTYPNVGVMILGNDSELSDTITLYKGEQIKIYSPGIIPYENIDDYIQFITIGFSFYEQSTVNIQGNASQKVRQYLSCGKPVFSTHHNHEFILDNKLGCIFEFNDYDAMVQEAIKWCENIKKNGKIIEKNIREYAINNLSCEHTFNQRMSLYHDLNKN